MTASREGALDGPLVAGVDVGGTKTLIVVTDCRDRILQEHVAPTDQSSLAGQIAGLVDDARRRLRQDIAAVGVAVPGFVDPNDGSVSMAVNLASPTCRWDRCCRRSWASRRSSSMTLALLRSG